MIYRFDHDDLSKRIARMLPSWKRLAFGVLLLERATPNFFRFAAETAAPGGSMLRGVQAKVWGMLETDDAAVFAGVTAKTCEPFAPDTEHYKSLYTSSALDAITIACNLLDYTESGRIELLVESASLRRDTVDMFLQLAERMDSSASDFEARLRGHPLMQEELGFQETDLAFLADVPSDRKQGWSSVFRRSSELGYSTFRMTLDRRFQ